MAEGGGGLGDSRLGCRCVCKRRHWLTLGSPGSVQLIGNELWSQPPPAGSLTAGEAGPGSCPAAGGAEQPRAREMLEEKGQILPLRSWMWEFGGLLEVSKAPNFISLQNLEGGSPGGKGGTVPEAGLPSSRVLTRVI